MKIALVGNPNCGKTTLFNALTGANQYVGNWPGVTVEKKEGKLKWQRDVTVTDLPGIYSLSPYSPEEMVARNYLVNESPDVIFNILDGTNLERNLYLTSQLCEFGIPMVVAVNMMDILRKNGQNVDIEHLSKRLGCIVVEISALKNTGTKEALDEAIKLAGTKTTVINTPFDKDTENALSEISNIALEGVSENKRRWFSVKLFERDMEVSRALGLNEATTSKIEALIKAVEEKLDDDSEGIIINARYNYITDVLVKKENIKSGSEKLTLSDKIDKVVTNRFLALPIFGIIIFLVYYISVTTVGTWATDWANDGLFGDGFHLFGIGGGAYEEAMDEYALENLFNNEELKSTLEEAVEKEVIGAQNMLDALNDGSFSDFDEAYATYSPALDEAKLSISHIYDEFTKSEGIPSPSDYGLWLHGVPVLFDMMLLDEGGEPIVTEWFYSLVQDGIVGGVGAVLGFVPQILVLFILLAFLEACGYMSRIAFVLDRIFRRFGLSGKSFIPMLVGTGCGVPGIMASRTIESEKDRRMTIITTTFIPCGAKLPIIALVASTLFGGAWWVAPSAYFIGIGAVIISGIILKKTKLFASDPVPFIMELPEYHMPTLGNVMRSMWERGWSFIKKAGTIILLSAIIIWLGSNFYMYEGNYTFVSNLSDEALSSLDLGDTILGGFGIALGWLFAPLGFSSIEATVATFMGLVAKEEVVAVFGVLNFASMGKLAGFSFLIFNLLCAPCFAAIGAIKREMNSAKWTWFAIGYQTGFAYAISLIVYQLGCLFSPSLEASIIGSIMAFIVLLALIYMIVKPANFSLWAKIKELFKKSEEKEESISAK